MENKNLIIAVVIIAVVFIFVGTGFTGRAFWQPQPIQPTNVNAHRCQADSTCEVNGIAGIAAALEDYIIVGGGDNYIAIDDGAIVGPQGIKMFGDILLLDSNYQNPTTLRTTPGGSLIISTSGGSVMAENGLASNIGDFADFIHVGSGPNEVAIEAGSMRSNGWQGNGTAYACLTSAGQLIRSQTPCV